MVSYKYKAFSTVKILLLQKFSYVDLLIRVQNLLKYIVLLLTNCEVNTGKYLDCSFEVRTERSEVHMKN